VKQIFHINTLLNQIDFAFRALHNRNFKLFFIGQITSLLGTWIQNIALGWLVYRLTNSSVLLGIVGFAGQIPSLVVTPLSGVFADRLNRKKVLTAVQIGSMLSAFILAWLVLTNSIQTWHIIVLSILNGIALAVDTPFRHAFLIEMIDQKSLLPNAVAMNSTLINSARFVGPLVGGFLIALVGEGWCFFINGLSFLAVIIALLSMKIDKHVQQHAHNSILKDLHEGIVYSVNNKAIKNLILLLMAISFFGMPFQVFLPVYAKDIFGGGSQQLGLLTGAMGAGALTAAFYLASRKSIKGSARLIFFASLLFSIALIIFSLCPVFPLSMLFMFLVGLGMILVCATTNIVLQSIVDDDKRGRVVSLYGMTFLGIPPLGSLLLGSLTHLLSVPYLLFIAGCICLIASFLFLRNLKLIVHSIHRNLSRNK
jgi:MFS family permease